MFDWPHKCGAHTWNLILTSPWEPKTDMREPCLAETWHVKPGSWATWAGYHVWGRGLRDLSPGAHGRLALLKWAAVARLLRGVGCRGNCAQGCTLSLLSGSGEATQQGNPESLGWEQKAQTGCGPDCFHPSKRGGCVVQVLAEAIFKGWLPSKGPCSQHPCISGPVLAQCPQTLPYHSFKEPQQSCKQPRKLPREGRGHDASQPATDVECEGKAQSLLVRPCHELGILLGSHSQWPNSPGMSRAGSSTFINQREHL